jgi:hypothetical protein
MPPATQQEVLRLAEAAARQLSTLLERASVALLLQHPPPAAVSEQQQNLLHDCACALDTLMSALSGVSGAPVQVEQVRCREQSLVGLR